MNIFDRLVKSHLETVNLKLAVGGKGEQLVLRVQLGDVMKAKEK